jgi:endonuclease/exonuclease/phosphatase family metal-dependent hydrolase
MLSAITYNIQFGRNLKKIIFWLNDRKEHYDVICFQEFPKDQQKAVIQSLQPHGYQARFASGFVLRGRDYGQLTLINTKKLQFISHHRIAFGTNYIEKRLCKLLGERSSLVTELNYGKQTLVIANTHLITYAWNITRLKHLMVLLDYLKGKKGELPVVILGDFNYTSLLLRTRLFSLLQSHQFTNAHTFTTHQLFRIKHQLDYLFFKNCRVGGVEVLHQSFSDHLPVQFTLQLPHKNH